MPDDNTNTDTTTTTDTTSADQTGSTTSTDSSNSDYPEGLGDAGKRAIDRMKAERDEARRLLREAQAASQNTNNQQTQNTDTSDRNGRKDDDNKGKTAEQVEQEIIDRLTQGALRSSVREVASAKLTDPNDALVLGNWSDMQPNEYGEYDRTAITQKLDDLIKSKPYLAKSEKKFEGSADSGNRGDNAAQGQVTREQLKTMTPPEINKARAEGRLRDVLSGKS